jgi:cytochrome c556
VILKKVVLILTLIGAIVDARPWSMTQSQTVSAQSFKSLHQLMEEGIHDRFTFISFALWHDPDMTPEKMDEVARSADELRQLGEAIPAFRPRQLEAEWKKDEQKAFDAGAAELSNSAMMLARAATGKDRARAKELFDRLAESCKSCHAKFNKDLTHK